MHAQTHPAASAASCFHDYIEAVAHLPPQAARPLSLRLHFPAFDGDGADVALTTYLSYLKREAAMHAVLFTGVSMVRQLSFDGVAPSCLADRQLGSLLAHLREHYRFMPDAAGDYEATVGLAPAAGRLPRLRQLGFNRLRIVLDGTGGDPARLPALVLAAREAGFRAISVALADGAPGPDTAGAAQRMAERLGMAGYTAPGAQPDLRGTYLVGCGVGALGDVGRVRWQNVALLGDYYALLDRNQVPVGAHPEGIHISQTQAFLMQVKDFEDADQ